MKGLPYLLLAVFLLPHLLVKAQTAAELGRGNFDSVAPIVADTIVSADTTELKPVHNPRKATLRSAILPGWGQVYNREVWKVPIVYGALAIPGSLFFYNNTWYKRARRAYIIRLDNDTANFATIHPNLQVLSTESIRSYRNIFRRDRDYSVLYFLIFWGLNVVDATVFAHLKEFDVSEDLSLKINPAYNPLTKATGLGLVLGFKPHPAKKRLMAW